MQIKNKDLMNYPATGALEHKAIAAILGNASRKLN